MATDKTNDKKTAQVDAQRPPLSDLLTGVSSVVKEMREQIEYSRSLGDNWEADFLEQYCKQLEALISTAS